jgi:hypothetical protein
MIVLIPRLPFLKRLKIFRAIVHITRVTPHD